MNHEDFEEVEAPEMNEGDSGDSGDSGGSSGKKGGNKAGKKLGNKLMKKLIKLAVQVMAKLMAVVGPYVLGILALLVVLSLVFYIFFDITYETKGKEKEYQEESVEHENEKKKGDDGEFEASQLSAGNKIIKSYYAYYTQQSYYKVIDKKMYKADDKEVVDIKDKYNREKEFMLSPDFLWALDDFLNDDKHRFPEQFILPVHHDEETFELKDLTDKDDMLTVESQKYDRKTLKPIKGEKELGVWDYGFAPILQYKKFKEEQEYRGEVTEMQVWNKDKQKFETKNVSDGKKMTEVVSGFPQDVHMIEKVTSSIGTIENKISHQWENTGESWTKDFSETVTVDVRYKEKETRHKRNAVGMKLYYVVDLEGKPTDKVSPLTTLYPVMEQVEVTKWKKEKKSAKRKAEGFRWSKEPRYDGEPDTSKIKGSKYMEDYMLNYISYVPTNVLGEFDLENRTGKSIAGLEQILEEVEEDLDADSEYDNDETPGATPVDNAIGVEGGSDKFKKAMQYAQYFQKYGEMYGIDPLLLAAKGAQERGGVHSTVKDPGGALGVMQIQVGQHLNSPKSAFNYKTGKKDTVIATMANIQNLETNIQLGAIIMANSISDQKYNPLLGLQSYNYGSGGMNKVINAYASAKGISADDVRKNVKDNGWMPYREKVHGKGYGDVKYIENVLSHYPGGSGQKPYILNKEGNKVYIDGNIEMGSGIPSATSGTGFSFWDFLDVLQEKWGELFPDAPEKLSEERERFNNQQIGDRPTDIMNLSFSMTEGKLFSEYGYITLEMWKEKYKLLFSNPPSAAGGVDPDASAEISKYFPNGTGEVIAKAEKIAVPYNGRSISIKAAKGTKVLALAEGTVKEIGRDFVLVDHGTGAMTRYSTLAKVNVKEGDKVKQGATLGTSNTNVVFEMTFDGSPTDPSWVVHSGSLTGVFITPAEGRFSSPYGPRKSPTNSGINFHYGIDIANAIGTPIKAAADGVVLKSGSSLGGYGQHIHIKHTVNGKTMSTLYGHLSARHVKVGDKVVKGQVIGKMGNTGRSTGPHLHFEIQNSAGYHNSAPLDPAKFIKL